MKDSNYICDSDVLFGHYEDACKNEHCDVPSPNIFKRAVSSVLGVHCKVSTVGGSTKSYYPAIRYIGDVPVKCIDYQRLPKGWLMSETEEQYTVLIHTSDFKVNGYTVLHQVIIGSDGSVKLQVGSNCITPSNVGLPDNIKHSVVDLTGYLSLVLQLHVCHGKRSSENDCNIVVTLSNGSTHFGRQSGKCLGYVPTTSRGMVCPKCVIINTCHTNNTDPVVDSTFSENTHHAEVGTDSGIEATPDTGITVISEEELSKYFPNCDTLLNQIIIHQSQCLVNTHKGKDERCRRWPKEILSFAISVFITSPRTYRLISQTLYLPSESLIKKYKNNLDKQPGINDDFICWMSKEADRTGSPKVGGVLFDEMTIQSGVQLEPHGEGLSFTGFVDFGEDNQGTHELYKDGKPAEIATSVLQFIFLSVTGFRFPFSYMLVKGVTTGELHTIVMDIFQTLASYEFKVIFVCMDGAAINRSFCNTISDCNSAIATNIVWLYSKLYCIMDVSHVIKKLRNSLFASGSGEQHKRRILHRLGYIDWDMFVNAYMWDCNHHTLRIHRKLSNEHFFLNNSLKMRNHLADQVLNSDMLYLMQSYSQSLESPNVLHACVDMLKHTAIVIDIFRSYLPISSPNDERLSDLRSCANFFRNWQIFCSDNKENNNNFFTKESYSDLMYCLNGFIYMCKEYANDFPIQPNMINSDIVENIFCQQRSIYAGPNTNPDATQYR